MEYYATFNTFNQKLAKMRYALAYANAHFDDKKPEWVETFIRKYQEPVDRLWDKIKNTPTS